LKEKLDKELGRVKNHYIKQIREKDEEVERCEEKINIMNSKLKHTFYERDARILQMKIRESKTRLEELKKRTYLSRMKSEEIFHINDETDKHTLAIDHTLINATIIHYPIYSIKFSKKGGIKEKDYDPVLKKFL
jgi:carboxypeptidase C (cathepsin A)